MAIVDLSPEANQPFASSDGRYIVSYNGEIYNFRAIREGLKRDGVQFRTRSDTEVLVEAYRRWGRECLGRFDGQFALAIWDSVDRRLFCARDRAGEKPFYYGLIGDTFVFASELKGILPWPGLDREIDFEALVDYLSFGFVADPKSIWRGISKLSAGHCMVVDLPRSGPPLVRGPLRYWDLEFAPDHGVLDWGPAIRTTLEDVAREMAFADVPVGAFLSGGVDSAGVTAALSKAGCDVNTFTIGFEEQEFDERAWARQVAGQYRTKHTERVLRAEDVAPVFEKLLWHYDEPFNDYSYLPTYYLCRESRRNITVALSGDGGDELFGGYRKYQRIALRQHVERIAPPAIRRMAAAGAGLLLPDSTGLYRSLIQHGADRSTAFLDMFTTGMPYTALRSAARGQLAATLRHYTPMDVVEPLILAAPPDRVGLVNTMRYLDLKLTLAGDILVKVDRASMAVSLEVRPVLLHRAMLDLAARIPAHVLATRSDTKLALKSALEPWLPKPLLYRRKQGFALPLRSWFRTGAESVVGTGIQGGLKDILDDGLFSSMLSKHIAGAADLTSALHSYLHLERWLAAWMA